MDSSLVAVGLGVSQQQFVRRQRLRAHSRVGESLRTQLERRMLERKVAAQVGGIWPLYSIERGRRVRGDERQGGPKGGPVWRCQFWIVVWLRPAVETGQDRTEGECEGERR